MHVIKPNISGVHLQFRFQNLKCLMWGTKPSPLTRNPTFLRSLLTMDHHVGGGIFGRTMSLPPPPASIWPFYPSLWSSYSATSQVLFRANCSIYRCIFFYDYGRKWVQNYTLPPSSTSFSAVTDSIKSVMPNSSDNVIFETKKKWWSTLRWYIIVCIIFFSTIYISI